MSKKQAKPGLSEIETAYHEAGHAVISLFGTYTKLRLRDVTIVPTADARGYTLHGRPPKHFRPDIEWNPQTEWRVRDRIKVLLAGAVAARKRCKRARGLHGDRGQIADYLIRLSAERGLDNAWMKILEAEVRRDVDRYWPAIEAVAMALLTEKRITGNRVRAIAEKGLGWPSVKLKRPPRRLDQKLMQRQFAASNEPGTCLWCGKQLRGAKIYLCSSRCAEPFALAAAEEGYRCQESASE